MTDLLNLYENLKSYTKAESKMISENNFEKLKEKLSQKNELINKIDQIKIPEYFAKLAFSLNQTELKAKKNKLQQIMEEINELQSQNIENMENKKEKNKEKMIALYSREKSIKGYLNSDKYEAKFFDKKS